MKIKQELKSMFTEHWKYMAVSAACKLNLFDNIPDIGINQNRICDSMNFNPEVFDFLVSSLVDNEFLKRNNGVLFLTEKSILLTEDNPETLKFACLNWSSKHLDTWQNLDYTIKTGKPAFDMVFGLSFFEHLNNNPEDLNKYHLAMHEYARDDYKNISEIIDFTKHKTVIDVGGGYGALINNIKTNNPQINCILFDLPQVIKNVVPKNIITLSGDFFNNVPNGCDAIILSRIIHDWDDENALKIIHNCHRALSENGSIYIIENCIDKTDVDFSLLNLNMSVMCNSFERTSSQYISLLNQQGFALISDIKLNQLQTILIFNKL